MCAQPGGARDHCLDWQVHGAGRRLPERDQEPAARLHGGAPQAQGALGWVGGLLGAGLRALRARQRDRQRERTPVCGSAAARFERSLGPAAARPRRTGCVTLCAAHAQLDWVEASNLEAEAKESNPEAYAASWAKLKAADGVIVPGAPHCAALSPGWFTAPHARVEVERAVDHAVVRRWVWQPRHRGHGAGGAVRAREQGALLWHLPGHAGACGQACTSRCKQCSKGTGAPRRARVTCGGCCLLRGGGCVGACCRLR